jgi:hypothetical protein
MRRLLTALFLFAGNLARGEGGRAETTYLLDFHAGLRSWLTPEELERAPVIDPKLSRRGNIDRVLYLAADRAVHVFLPQVLLAWQQSDDAARVSSLPPIVDHKSAEVARAALANLHDRHLPSGTDPSPLCATPVARARSAVEDAALIRKGRLPYGMNVPGLACAAVKEGADRARAVEESLSLLKQLMVVAHGKSLTERR